MVSGLVPKRIPVLIDALREEGCEAQSMGWGRHQHGASCVVRAWSGVRDVLRVQMVLRRMPFDVLVVKTAHEWVSMLRDIPLLLATRRACPRIVLQFQGGRADRLALAAGRELAARSLPNLPQRSERWEPIEPAALVIKTNLGDIPEVLTCLRAPPGRGSWPPRADAPGRPSRAPGTSSAVSLRSTASSEFLCARGSNLHRSLSGVACLASLCFLQRHEGRDASTFPPLSPRETRLHDAVEMQGGPVILSGGRA